MSENSNPKIAQLSLPRDDGFHRSTNKPLLVLVIVMGLGFGSYLYYDKNRQRLERRNGVLMQRLRVSGGGAQSTQILQLTANVFNLPVERPHTSETSALGAAISAMVGLGRYANHTEALNAMCRPAQPRFAVQPQQALAQQHWAQQAKNQLAAYFAKELTQFELPLCASGTLFQQQVWQALTTVPYGKTASYGDIAKAINNPKGVRAVGLANGKNPLGIIVPCHRIIGANGTLTGYAGGLDKKARLLAHEGATFRQ